MASINLLDKLNDLSVGGGQRIEIKEAGSGEAAPSRFSLSMDSELSADNKRQLVWFMIGLGILFGSNFLLTDYTERLVSEKEVEIAQVDTQLAAENQRTIQLKDVREEADRYQVRIDDITAKLKKVELLGQNRNYLVRAVDFVVQEMPTNIWIRDVKINMIDEGSLVLGGYSTTMQVVGDFLQQLQPGSFYNDWNLIETVAQESNDAKGSAMPRDSKTFNITAKVVLP